MNDYLEILRELSLFFKLESKSKFRKAVALEDAIKTLKSIEQSYNAFVEAEYFRINTQNEKKKYNKIKEALVKENQLLIVDLKFESLGINIAPDTINTSFQIPNIKNNIAWKKNIYSDFISTVIESDYTNENFLNKVTEKYDSDQRFKIFNPIIKGIILNEDAKFYYSRNKNKLKKISEISNTTIERLISNKETFKRNPDIIETKTSLALVELKGEKIKPKVLQLFESIERPIIKLEEIDFEIKRYKLSHPIYCEIEITQDGVLLQNEDLGIFVFEDSLENAKQEFSKEFDFIYNRYNEIEDEKLTSDVLNIKKLLNIIV
ncbi:hypothetical protein ACFPIK_05545 [Algoriphagus aquatilis]|uniref:Uncharacterized protein n=1 Tax=Algoriphagus aquatilis TaxID=490186 RepID=A0ABW0BUF0_9BACT